MPLLPRLLVDGHVHGAGLLKSQPQLGVVSQRFSSPDPFRRGLFGIERAKCLDQLLLFLRRVEIHLAVSCLASALEARCSSVLRNP